jgi:uncharacterized protein (TIGR02246 family)
MKNLMTTLFVTGMFLTTAALADDVEDVKAAVQKYFDSLNSGDVDAWVQLFTEGHTTFAGDGSLLEANTSLEEQRKARQAGVDSGLARNLQARHMEVQVYGNLTAVATNYVVGNLTPTGGSPQRVLRRRTAVLIKQGGQWKIVHRHISSLTLP